MTKRRPDRPENPDIEFTANVKAKELRFDEVPETEVRFSGNPERESASGTDRENLPDEVEPDVTYRNPEVRLRIASALARDDPDLQQWFDGAQEDDKEGPTRRKK